MKIFAVYSNVKLTSGPSWLESFRKKYDESYELHVTFKQPCFIEEDQVNDLKDKLSLFFKDHKVPNHEILVLFDKLFVEENLIMIRSSENSELDSLQKGIVNCLSDYKRYFEPELEAYEMNFHPHLTIARDLNKEQLSVALKEIEDSFSCEGVIKDITLSVVEKITPEEAKIQKNQTLYKF